MRLDLQPGIKDIASILKPADGASRDGARIQWGCGAVGVMDVGLNPRGICQPVQSEEPVRIRHQDNVTKPGQPGQTGGFILPDRQNGPV